MNFREYLNEGKEYKIKVDGEDTKLVFPDVKGWKRMWSDGDLKDPSKFDPDMDYVAYSFTHPAPRFKGTHMIHVAFDVSDEDGGTYKTYISSKEKDANWMVTGYQNVRWGNKNTIKKVLDFVLKDVKTN